jgi:hypothetical protein
MPAAVHMSRSTSAAMSAISWYLLSSAPLSFNPYPDTAAPFSAGTGS